MKKRVLLFVFAVAFLFAGCFPQGLIKFNVNFIVDGEVYATVKTDASSINMPADPKKDGHDFGGWFWDEGVWEKPFTLKSIVDAPLFETFRIYAKFTLQGLPGDPVYTSRFYRLQEAYDSGLLHKGNLMDIAFYHDGSWPVFISRAPMSKTPEFLSEETESKIKQAFLDEFLLNNDDCVDYTADDVRITNYCGTYGDAVVVFLDGLYCYTEALSSETVEGIVFNYNNGNYLRVFVEQEQVLPDAKEISFQVKAAENHMSSTDGHDVLSIVRSKEELDAIAAVRFHQYWTSDEGPFSVYYLADLTGECDEEFFADNALVLCLFGASTAGGTIDIKGLQAEGGDLAVIRDFHPGMADAISYWTVVIAVPKSDVSGITCVKILDQCACDLSLIG